MLAHCAGRVLHRQHKPFVCPLHAVSGSGCQALTPARLPAQTQSPRYSGESSMGACQQHNSARSARAAHDVKLLNESMRFCSSRMSAYAAGSGPDRELNVRSKMRSSVIWDHAGGSVPAPALHLVPVHTQSLTVSDDGCMYSRTGTDQREQQAQHVHAAGRHRAAGRRSSLYAYLTPRWALAALAGAHRKCSCSASSARPGSACRLPTKLVARRAGRLHRRSADSVMPACASSLAECLRPSASGQASAFSQVTPPDAA